MGEQAVVVAHQGLLEGLDRNLTFAHHVDAIFAYYDVCNNYFHLYQISNQIKYKSLTLHVINLHLTRDREVPVASSRQIIFIELIVMFGELNNV